MKKLIIGVIIGFSMSFVVAVSASNTVETYLFPAKFLINGQPKEVSQEYTILNYKGHTYAPIRFIAENTGEFVDYDNNTETVKLNYFPINSILLTDKVFPRFHIGNIYLEYNNGKTKISGLMSVDANTIGQPIQQHHVSFSINFNNEKNEQIGKYLGYTILTEDIKDGEIRYFEGTVDGDISKYVTATLDTGFFDYAKGD
jgi:hypothetical protein